jgi:hypothetical protein
VFPANQAAEDLRLGHRGHWDQPLDKHTVSIFRAEEFFPKLSYVYTTLQVHDSATQNKVNFKLILSHEEINLLARLLVRLNVLTLHFRRRYLDALLLINIFKEKVIDQLFWILLVCACP